MSFCRSVLRTCLVHCPLNKYATSWICLYQVVQETIDPNARIEFKPNTEDDPHMRKPDISKAKELLGWEPKIPLNKGLPMMISDFRQRIFGDQKVGNTTAF